MYLFVLMVQLIVWSIVGFVKLTLLLFEGLFRGIAWIFESMDRQIEKQNSSRSKK